VLEIDPVKKRDPAPLLIIRLAISFPNKNPPKQFTSHYFWNSYKEVSTKLLKVYVAALNKAISIWPISFSTISIAFIISSSFVASKPIGTHFPPNP